MIPVKLTLKNFMSYGEEPTILPFQGLHVVCLSGDNGNGKSALLDAITWALWGQTRLGATGSDDLIRLGAEEMEVRFEFELSGGHYRVVRKRKRGKTAGDWQLTQKNSKEDFVPVGGAGARETGKQIVKLLSMEHETFINSAYLQQGRADSFTRQRASDRKRILAEILGLGQYDLLEEKAKERTKQAKAQADEVAVQLRMLEGQAGRMEEYQEQAKLAEERIAEQEPKIAAQAKFVSEYTQQVGRIDLLEQEREQARVERDRLSMALQKQITDIRTLKGQLEAMEKIRAQRDLITADYQRVQRLKTECAELVPKVTRYHTVERDRAIVQGEIGSAKAKLEGDIRVLESQLKSVERRKAELSELEAQIAQLEKALSEEAQSSQQWTQAEANLKKVEEAFAQLKTRNDQLKAALTEQEEALEVLHQPRAECPVCGSDLRDEKRERVLARQEEKRRQILEDVAALKQEGSALKQSKTAAETQYKSLTQQKEAFARQRTQLEGHHSRARQLKGEGADATAAQLELQQLRQSLQTGSYTGAKQARLQILEQELALLETAKIRFDEIDPLLKRQQADAESRHQNLLKTDENFDKTVTESRTLTESASETTKLLEAADKRHQEYALGLEQANEIRRQLHVEESQLAALRGQLERAKADLSAYQGYIRDAEKAQREHAEKTKEHRLYTQDKNSYTALAGAFGKKGIQAMIIDNALPEIQDEANELLHRMTDGSMSVALTTTREKKSGDGAIETLDILVSDDMGTRPFELFSGGEGFRVNFALRLALSRLLARRSGAKLETLIIDEGFGSQDGKGRDRIVEVIEAIKSDFHTVLVITHFEELKDAFAQRIEVVKDANGSRIHLM